MMDQVGLDVVLDIEDHYAAIRDGIPDGPRTLLQQYIERGRLGVKSGRGFYADYAGSATESMNHTDGPGGRAGIESQADRARRST